MGVAVRVSKATASFSNSLYTSNSYHVPSDQWKACAGMNTCRSAAGAAMLGGDIYVVGEYMYIYMCRQVVCRRILRKTQLHFHYHGRVHAFMGRV